MITEYKGWKREKPGLGVWPHRGKVAIAGLGHSNLDRRWDGQDMSKTLGAKAIQACEHALADAGISKDQVDGLLCCPLSLAGEGIAGAAGHWGPRPYFSAPYDSEWGLSVVNNQWLIQNMGLNKVEFAPNDIPHIWDQTCMTAQAVADGKCKVALMVYTGANFEGRYRRGGENAESQAKGMRAFTAPWGNHGGNDFVNVFPLQQYCQRYGYTPDDVGPFVVNQHRNGLMSPWSFYANQEPAGLTLEEYKSSRFILRPLHLWDCDRPIHGVTAYVFTTAERAKDMRQPPVYVLGHAQHTGPTRSTQPVLDDMEASTDLGARMLLESAALTPKDIDILNPYDGYAYMTQFWLEAFQFHGVKRGDALRFYADDIRVEGPHPFCSGGGNLGNGRTRSAMYTDTIEQLRGRVGVAEGFTDPVKHLPLAGKRKVRTRAEIGLCASAPPLGGGFLALGKHPS